MKQKGLKYALIICLAILLASGVIYWLFQPKGYMGKKGNPSFYFMNSYGMLSAADSRVIYVDCFSSHFTKNGGNNWQQWPLDKPNTYKPQYRDAENREDLNQKSFGMGFFCPVDEGAGWYEDILLNTSGDPINPQFARAGDIEKEAFLRVSPVSRETAWVATRNVEENRLYAYRTTNSGSTWERHELPYGCKGNKVLALDGESCWVDDYHTTDGGVTWEAPPQELTLEEFTETNTEELLQKYGYLFNGYGGLKLVDRQTWKSWGWDSDCRFLAISVTRERDIVLIKYGKVYSSSVDRGRTWREIDDSAFAYDSLNTYILFQEHSNGLVSDEICIAGKDTYFLGRPDQFLRNASDQYGPGEVFNKTTGVGLIFTHDGGASWQYASIHKYPTWIYKVSFIVSILSLATLLTLFFLWVRKRRPESTSNDRDEAGAP